MAKMGTQRRGDAGTGRRGDGDGETRGQGHGDTGTWNREQGTREKDYEFPYNQGMQSFLMYLWVFPSFPPSLLPSFPPSFFPSSIKKWCMAPMLTHLKIFQKLFKPIPSP